MRTLLLIFLLSASANGATYYVSPSGDDGADGSLSTPWLSFAKFGVLEAGDVGYLRGGTYDATSGTQYFAPTNSGTSGNWITISNYPGEVPMIAGSTNNQQILDFVGVSYITVNGLTITNCARPVQWDTTTNCELANCTVVWRGAVPFGVGDAYLVRIWNGSCSNIIRQCTIAYGMIGDPTVPVTYEGSDIGPVFCMVLGNYTQTYNCYANRLENCTLYAGGHDTLALCGAFNVIRSNYISNAGWYRRAGYTNLMAGNRAIESSGTNSYRNLIENNRVGPTGWVLDNGSAGFTISSRLNIIRRNTFNGCANFGFELYTKDYGASGITYASSNAVYNNTLTYNGWVPATVTNTSTSAITTNTAYAAHTRAHLATNNVIKNNLFWRGFGNAWFGPATNAIFVGTEYSSTWANNYSNSDVNVQFVDAGSAWSNPYATDTVASATSPNFRLQSSSPLIDAGGYLTVAASSGSGTTLAVADASYFCDGFGIVAGDSIQLEGQSSRAVVTAVDYDSNTLTLASGLSWSSGQGVALSYAGASPDVGAYEYEPPSLTIYGTLTVGNLVIGNP